MGKVAAGMGGGLELVVVVVAVELASAILTYQESVTGVTSLEPSTIYLIVGVSLVSMSSQYILEAAQ